MEKKNNYIYCYDVNSELFPVDTDNHIQVMGQHCRNEIGKYGYYYSVYNENGHRINFRGYYGKRTFFTVKPEFDTFGVAIIDEEELVITITGKLYYYSEAVKIALSEATSEVNKTALKLV